MTGLIQDLRYALRQLRKSPGFTAVAVVTLALGIAANTAIFGVIDALLVRALPFGAPDRLVWLNGKMPMTDEAGVSPPDLRQWATLQARRIFLATNPNRSSPPSHPPISSDV